MDTSGQRPFNMTPHVPTGLAFPTETSHCEPSHPDDRLPGAFIFLSFPV
jgi:hypothetical protein